MSATLFHLVRHASHDRGSEVLVGRGPAALSAQGEREAAALAGSGGFAAGTEGGLGGPAAPRLAAVVSSPRERARRTAEAIAARARLAVTEEPGLDELDFGAWTGMSFAALREDPRWQAFNTFRSAAPIPGGETMLAVQARAVTVVLRLRAAWPDAALVLVSHADVLKAVLAHFLAVPLELMRRIELAPASRSELVVWEQDAVVRGVNLPAGM
jgi:broad specificity phosphatase PhoE